MRTLAFGLRKIMTGPTPRRRAEGGASAARRDEEALAEKDASHQSKNVDFWPKWAISIDPQHSIARSSAPSSRKIAAKPPFERGDRGASSGTNNSNRSSTTKIEYFTCPRLNCLTWVISRLPPSLLPVWFNSTRNKIQQADIYICP